MNNFRFLISDFRLLSNKKVTKYLVIKKSVLHLQCIRIVEH